MLPTLGPAPALDYLPPAPAGPAPPVALIGCGGVSNLHLAAYRELGLQVVALCDVDRTAAERRRAEFYPGAEVFTDHRELLARCPAAVVDVATHVDVRLDIVRACLLAGRHVLSQKPFAIDLDDAERLCDLADSRNLALAVNHNGRFAPHFAWLLAAARGGLLGRVETADFSLFWPHDQAVAGTVFADMRDLVLFDYGIHWFDLLGMLFAGRPATGVYASARPTASQRITAPTLATALIEFPDAQAVLRFHASATTPELGHYRVGGDLGTVSNTGTTVGGERVILDTPAGTGFADLPGRWLADGFRGSMSALLAALDRGEPPLNAARTSIPGLALCFAAVESARTGRPVRPGTVRSISP
ncbi:NADH-dependent dehydrogenase [Acrocarpospora corrugata]|uniref:NADH-dependent dehydrogenase n=1 Tax=Acrocarpospora corrugata TaxID=35763 RepID=A0A5M3VUQ6_9ACTN|nr:Gfo/Idh/MocA family oxidoreductase [Acrocarpospora corrugata]GER99411.1 NADH-dependent dehydrogenase [Acrocarpospora corrugata]